MTTMEQLELGLAGEEPGNRSAKKKQRSPKFWFEQMRNLVDQAVDWGSLDAPPARQTFLKFKPEKKSQQPWRKAA